MAEGAKGVAACPHCGSINVRPRRILAGPIMLANRGANTYHCDECGRDGVLVTFESQEALDRFRSQKQVEIAGKLSPKVESIPILPIYSKPLLGAAILESVPFRSADVVSVRWNGHTVDRTGYEVSFDKYWEAIGGSRYGGEKVYVLDISGINHAEPSFAALRGLSKSDCEIYLDLGAGGPGDIMDGFMVDVAKVIASTKSLKGPQDFKDIYALTDDCIPCIDWEDGIVWGPGNKKERPERLAKILFDIGYDSIVLMDLRRLGTWSGPAMDLVTICPQLDARTYLGGGIKEEDVPLLFEKGLDAALIDPYTPMLRDMVFRRDSAPKATAVTAPKPSPTKDVRPSPA